MAYRRCTIKLMYKVHIMYISRVKLSLRFTWAPLLEGVFGSGGIEPRILDLGTRLRWVVSFTSRPLYPWDRAPGTHWIGGWVVTRAGLDAVVKRKIPSLCRDKNPPIIQPVAQRYTTELSRFPAHYILIKFFFDAGGILTKQEIF
jgi:hypothetical protein